MSKFRRAFKPKRIIREFIEQAIPVSIERLMEGGVPYAIRGYILGQDEEFLTFLSCPGDIDPGVLLISRRAIFSIYENDEPEKLSKKATACMVRWKRL